MISLLLDSLYAFILLWFGWWLRGRHDRMRTQVRSLVIRGHVVESDDTITITHVAAFGRGRVPVAISPLSAKRVLEPGDTLVIRWKIANDEGTAQSLHP